MEELEKEYKYRKLAWDILEYIEYINESCENQICLCEVKNGVHDEDCPHISILKDCKMFSEKLDSLFR